MIFNKLYITQLLSIEVTPREGPYNSYVTQCTVWALKVTDTSMRFTHLESSCGTWITCPFIAFNMVTSMPASWDTL